ncbi:molybdate transport system substrate-binding protein [Salana multivorans]|uniref:Molybdate transport system substrate-binding protein n=1 Tax=Salana multivorans TaxID=120377 RepID=A0A3N2D9L1_9MICO|nr:molybdate ABC transporter substrate-binding protein [Salana multivorans]ROR96480.1 molybdate transport system substrate-binding protein [Salana multivorans]
MITSTRRTGALALAAVLSVGLAACTSSPASSPSGDASSGAAADSTDDAGTASESASVDGSDQVDASLTGDLVVLAAASLTDAFGELGAQLEEENPGLTVSFSFAASSALAEQVLAGSPADVLATASAKTMEQVGDLAVDPADFATNTLVIVTPAGNPAGITGIADFAREDLRLAVCAEEVPCGALSAKVFETLGITPSVDTYAEDVRAALTLAEQGEVDATLVYRTDAIVGGDGITTIEFPEASQAVNDYPIAVLSESPNPDAAAAFVALVLSADGRAVLDAAGFSPPR